VHQLRQFAYAARAGGVGLLVGCLALLVTGLVGWAMARLVGLSDHDYAAGVLPTLVGVIAGLPIALWLIRVGESASRESAAVAARNRRKLVLGVIDHELQEALDQLKGDRARRPRALVIPFLKTEAWRALADGGELKWIEDPELIDRFARAYHRIETTTMIEQAMYAYMNNPATPEAIALYGAGPRLQTLADTVAEQDEHTIAAIEHALAAIRDALRVT
jgi:hypothetical protein